MPCPRAARTAGDVRGFNGARAHVAENHRQRADHDRAERQEGVQREIAKPADPVSPSTAPGENMPPVGKSPVFSAINNISRPMSRSGTARNAEVAPVHEAIEQSSAVSRGPGDRLAIAISQAMKQRRNRENQRVPRALPEQRRDGRAMRQRQAEVAAHDRAEPAHVADRGLTV